MTSVSISKDKSRTRAGILLVALALVGGTGCITTAIVQSVQQQNRLRAEEAVRQDRIAKLAPLADAGDPGAATNLARALIAVRAPAAVDQQRVLALLDTAARQDYAPAEALLGQILVTNQIETADFQRVALALVYQDQERGFRLLKQAATQACGFQASDYQRFRSIYPTRLLDSALEKAGRPEEALVWRARTALHCNASGTQSLLWQATVQNGTPQARMEALTLLLLTDDNVRIAKAEAALPAATLVAARRDVEALRRQVQLSLQQYPAPTRKEME